MDFNTITAEQEQAALAKFNKHNAGLIMNRMITARNVSADASKYAQLIDPQLFDLQTLSNKLREIGRTINNQVQDDLLGDSSVMFTTKDALDRPVEFTYLEAYSFLRAIIRERKEAKEYKEKMQRLSAAKAVLEGAKSIKDKRKDAAAEVAALEAELNITPAPTVG